MNLKSIIQKSLAFIPEYIPIGQIKEDKTNETSRLPDTPLARIVDIEETDKDGFYNHKIKWSKTKDGGGGKKYMDSVRTGHCGHFAGNPAEESKEFWDFLNATTAGHIGHFAGNPAHASVQGDFKRVLKVFDVTADKFRPVDNHTKSHKR